MSEDVFTPWHTDKERPPTLCYCGITHSPPPPKFRTGDKVVIGPGGYHHQEKVGLVAEILGLHVLMSCPCDENEYLLDIGGGAVLESRLSIVR